MTHCKIYNIVYSETAIYSVARKKKEVEASRSVITDLIIIVTVYVSAYSQHTLISY